MEIGGVYRCRSFFVGGYRDVYVGGFVPTWLAVPTGSEYTIVSSTFDEVIVEQARGECPFPVDDSELDNSVGTSYSRGKDGVGLFDPIVDRYSCKESDGIAYG